MAVLGPPGGVGEDGLPVLWPAATPGEFTGDDDRGEDCGSRTSVKATKSDCIALPFQLNFLVRKTEARAQIFKLTIADYCIILNRMGCAAKVLIAVASWEGESKNEVVRISLRPRSSAVRTGKI